MAVTPIRLEIRVADGRRDLVDTAKTAWHAFNTAIRHPLKLTGVNCGVTDIGCDAEALSRPFYRVGMLDDWAELILSVPLITTAAVPDRNLTLLHECIHMDFAFGDHCERWRRLLQRALEQEHELKMLMTADAPLLDFLWRRYKIAHRFRQVPDEIAAEESMKQHYSLWPTREQYYVRMRRNRSH